MQNRKSEIDDFVRKYERLVRAKVRSFLAKNPLSSNDYWLRDDLLQAAFMGVVQAFNTFDVQKGVPEQAYVSLKIDYALLQEFDRGNPVSSRAIAQLRRLNNDKENLEKLYNRSVTKAELADFLSISDEELAEILHISTLHSVQIDDEHIQEIYFNRESKRDSAIYRDELLRSVRIILSRLTQREKLIVKLLYIDSLSLGKIGEILGMRKQSVAGARDKILKKIRKFVDRDELIEKIKRSYNNDSFTI